MNSQATENKAISQLDLNLLKVFRALYYEQNMTRAADALNITPSAVSHAIKRLRLTLSEPLFERSQNRMRPTATCRRMAPDLIAALNHLNQLLQNWGDFDATQSQHNFQIGMHDGVEPSLLPKLAMRAAKTAPSISFTSVKLDRSSLASDLASGALDIALDVPLTLSSAVQSQRLLNNEFVVVMRSDHDFANNLNKSRYLKATHLVVSSRASGKSMEDAQMSVQGLRRTIGMRCQNYYAALEIVRHNDYLLTLPALLAEGLDDTELAVRDLPLKLPGFATQLYWHENFTDDPALKWLRQTIESLYPDPLD